MTEYRTNKRGAYQARDHCKYCHAVINRWHRCGQVPSIVLVERERDCPRCGKPSGVRSFYGNARLIPA